MISFHRISAPGFVAGIDVRHDEDGSFICEAPPILRWSIGREFGWFRGYCRGRGWEIEDD